MIDDIIADLKDRWEWTTEEALDVKLAMVNFAMATLHDEGVAEEVIDICMENDDV